MPPGITDDLTDHDLLIRLDTKMDNVLLRLDKGNDCLDEHDKRIDVLERCEAARASSEKTMEKISAKTALLVSFIVSTLISFTALVIELFKR